MKEAKVDELIFWVTPSTYSAIYSEKQSLYLIKLWSLVWSVPGPRFPLPVMAKRCAGDKVSYYLFFKYAKNNFIFHIVVICLLIFIILVILLILFILPFINFITCHLLISLLIANKIVARMMIILMKMKLKFNEDVNKN